MKKETICMEGQKDSMRQRYEESAKWLADRLDDADDIWKAGGERRIKAATDR